MILLTNVLAINLIKKESKQLWMNAYVNHGLLTGWTEVASISKDRVPVAICQLSADSQFGEQGEINKDRGKKEKVFLNK